jgi:hypothetical protein
MASPGGPIRPGCRTRPGEFRGYYNTGPSRRAGVIALLGRLRCRRRGRTGSTAARRVRWLLAQQHPDGFLLGGTGPSDQSGTPGMVLRRPRRGGALSGRLARPVSPSGNARLCGSPAVLQPGRSTRPALSMPDLPCGRAGTSLQPALPGHGEECFARRLARGLLRWCFSAGLAWVSPAFARPVVPERERLGIGPDCSPGWRASPSLFWPRRLPSSRPGMPFSWPRCRRARTPGEGHNRCRLPCPGQRTCGLPASSRCAHPCCPSMNCWPWAPGSRRRGLLPMHLTWTALAADRAACGPPSCRRRPARDSRGPLRRLSGPGRAARRVAAPPRQRGGENGAGLAPLFRVWPVGRRRSACVPAARWAGSMTRRTCTWRVGPTIASTRDSTWTASSP